MNRTWVNLSLVFLFTFSATTTYLATKSDSHYRAAEEFTKAAHMEENFNKLAEQALNQQIKDSPQMLPYKKTLKEFFNKYMGWRNVKNDVIKIYMDAFSEAELKELTAFHNTPVGQKAILLLPTLSQKAIEMATMRVQAHAFELNQMIKSESMKLYEQQNAESR